MKPARHYKSRVLGSLPRSQLNRLAPQLAAGILHRAGLIDYSRGHVTVKNRSGLEKAACECYEVVRREFLRLGLSSDHWNKIYTRVLKSSASVNRPG
jgi:hypothetical protein